MLIDMAPGIDENVLYLNTAAHEIVIIVTPDFFSLADAYVLIKVLNKYHKEDRFLVICN
jgi:flagellar biosynthesis protein FlhG